MKKLNTIVSLKILIAFVVLNFVSCSKDSDEPEQTGKTIITQDFSTTMDENPTNGQLIGTISGTTNQGSVSFSIIEQSPEGAFSIDASNGELKVADESIFNFEVNPTITGTVKVANGSLFEIAEITITLTDVEENRVFEGDVWLHTQNEIIQFGNAAYTHITGDLKIDPSIPDDIVDLYPLLNIEKIEGALIISYCSNLITTDGLRNVSQAGQGLIIGSNPGLKKITDLQNLTILGGDLYLADNYLLTEISGLNQLTEIKGNLNLFDSSIINLDDLINLKTIEGNLAIYGNLELLNIDGLSSLSTLGANIAIADNFYLANLNGLSNLTATVSVLNIYENASLTNIDGLHNIETTDRISIYQNNALKNLNGLSANNKVNRVEIKYNNSLTNLQGLNNLNTVGDNASSDGVYIERNSGLTNLSGLEGISQIKGALSIGQNYLLRDFCSLKNYLTTNNPSSYIVYKNFYNPTIQDIVNGNCSI